MPYFDEPRLLKLLDAGHELIALISREGRILFASRATLLILGLGPEHVVGKRFLDLVHPEDSAEAERVFSALLALPGVRMSVELRAVHKDGGDRHLECVGVNRLDDPEIGAVIAHLHDITARHEADDALRRSRAQLAEAQRIAKLTSWEWDIASDVVVDDAGECRVFGSPALERDSLETFLSWVHADDRERVREALRATLEDGQPYSVEYRARTTEGPDRTLRSQAELIVGAKGRPMRLVGTTQDVTEQRRLEDQLRQAHKMEAIGRLAGGIAHDFNNLLFVILGNAAEVLARLPEQDGNRALIVQVHEAAERAATLTRQLLAFGRRQVLSVRAVDVNELVETMTKMVGRLLGEDVTLALDLQPGLAAARADPAQLQQVVLNLCVNARDAMPRGGTLTMKTREVATDERNALSGVPPGAWVELSVADSGTGLDPKMRAHIFEPFFTTKAAGKGTGLGLATVYAIVEQSEGKITVESERGRGTTFRVFLRRAAVDPSTPRVEERVSRPPETLGGTETILLVEDEAAVRGLIRRVLSSRGYDVIDVSAGAEALARAEDPSLAIDLLLTDVVMPGMSGRELAERLSARRPGLKVLFMTGHTDDEVLRRGIRDRASAWLAKPFTAEALLVSVRKSLR